ncbi:kelch repeat-containing protein [Nocardiopsis sp. FR4]|uniref:Kelch repeat-containing protein n=1 Tax=Nocardiopsis sp. FR4 TaxID=2605985 RepID=UPI0013579ACD|nr:kelch repeat-containing protein [Nocardiopsis sp. FR4]
MKSKAKVASQLLVLTFLIASCATSQEHQWNAKISVSNISESPLALRNEHSLIWSGEELLVWGGHSTTQHDSFSDGAAYSPETDSWRRIAEGELEPRTRHTAVLVRERMLVWGGFTPDYSNREDGHLTREGAFYDPKTDTWEPIAEAPEARSSARAVNLDQHVIFAGGYNELGSNSLLIYSLVDDTWETIPLTGADAGFQVYDLQVLNDSVMIIGNSSLKLSMAMFRVGETSAPVQSITGLEEIQAEHIFTGLAISPTGEALMAVRGGEQTNLYELDEQGQAELVGELDYSDFRPPVSSASYQSQAGEMEFLNEAMLIATAPGEFSLWNLEEGTHHRSQENELKGYCDLLIPISENTLLGWGGFGCEPTGVKVDMNT